MSSAVARALTLATTPSRSARTAKWSAMRSAMVAGGVAWTSCGAVRNALARRRISPGMVAENSIV
jgi:hypothetical protein